MIELKGVTKIYDGIRVVDNLSFSVKKGTVFGFLGANGAGKTTTLKMLSGINRPTEGSITVEASPADSKASKNLIGFLPETPSFYDYLTGLEFLKFCGELSSPSHIPKERYDGVLKEMDIFDAREKAVRTYSKGMRQRLGFAAATIHNPPYVFLDEPLDGLDPLGRNSMKKIIKKLKAEGKTVFFSSHILFDTEELCEEIGIIHKGRLLYKGGVAEFTRGAPLETRFVEIVEKAQ